MQPVAGYSASPLDEVDTLPSSPLTINIISSFIEEKMNNFAPEILEK